MLTGEGPPTDLMIAAGAIEHGGERWHLDQHFERMARVAPLKQERWGRRQTVWNKDGDTVIVKDATGHFVLSHTY